MGVEALIRWPQNNPQNYTPDQFMGVIESTDLVHEVGDWVIKEACIACKAWHQKGHKISVAVNVSAQQLLNPMFADKVQTFLSSVQLPPEYLEIELTERYLVDNGSDVEKQLAVLRKIGVKLAIDDFGTGYSNISYLTDLDVDVLKLDQSFVQQLQSNQSVKYIVEGIIKVAHVMGMDVVAEGVETREEMQQVIDLGCEVGQGYHWSKPVTFNDMVMYLAEHRQPLISNSTG
jgi:EAL domain-containing protein (putative c-di-GMP-specific phosphodiesterase class I)